MDQKRPGQQEETAMRVFVVVTHYMSGTQPVEVFSSKEAAQAYISTRNDEGGSPTIEEFPVQGTIKTAGFVYTAGYYNSGHDIHHLVGIYGSFDEANKAAGEHGEVLKKDIRNS